MKGLLSTLISSTAAMDDDEEDVEKHFASVTG